MTTSEYPRRKIVLFGVKRHAIAIDDFYMFFSRTKHEIVRIFFPADQVANRDWWDFGRRIDGARNNIVDPINKDKYQIDEWRDIDKVISTLESIEWDICCMGNGNSSEQQKLVKHFGVERFLFSEYGWLPWSEHFYISRKGTGFASEIAEAGLAELETVPERNEGIEAFRRTLDVGNPCYFKNFIYLPMQKDVNDFKFSFTRFASNLDFLRAVDSYAPDGYPILVKRHPLYPVRYDLSFSKRMIDITDWNLNKYEIYSAMDAMICINSTSVLEAIAFEKMVFAYGEDIFLNKGVVHFDVSSPERFSALLHDAAPVENYRRFISLLLERQINRKRCIENDRNYIDQHYWNLNL